MMNAATQSLQSQSEKPIAESHHIDISTDGYNDAHSNMSTDGHINFAKDVADEEIKDSHTNISTDGYVDAAQCEYKIVPVDEDMSRNDHFQAQNCEDNTVEEPSAVEEPTIFEDAAEASTIATDLVNDEAVESTTLGEHFCSEDEIMRITDDPLNHPNAPDDAQVGLKPHTPHIKFVDVNDANKFSVVIFVDMAVEKEERLLQQSHLQHYLLTYTAYTIIATHKQIGDYLKMSCCHTYQPQPIEHAIAVAPNANCHCTSVNLSPPCQPPSTRSTSPTPTLPEIRQCRTTRGTCNSHATPLQHASPIAQPPLCQQPSSRMPSLTPTLPEVRHCRTTRGTCDNHATLLQNALRCRAMIFILYNSPKWTSMASSSRHRLLQIITMPENHHGCTTRAH
ncbi:hypothetical protein DEO72_LG5g806 [Vigna unguiculata]|uniref:Uncharacterized protein n=1 Tax=Vigna unguiculata TaxID=3917 RepID=A0A4D6LVP0_VIGUN|nr:hypothetical protein DEO72_LG5g806 [Vigna unguiculata]